jgi:hypothetical protein
MSNTFFPQVLFLQINEKRVHTIVELYILFLSCLSKIIKKDNYVFYS